MRKNKVAHAAFIAAAVSAVIVSPIPGHAIEHGQWMSEDSGVLVNPAYANATIAQPIISSFVAFNTSTLEASSLGELTALLENEFSRQSTLISVHYTGDTSNINEQIETILKDYQYENDYFRGAYAGAQYSYKGYVNDITITLAANYHTTPEQEAFIQSEVERIVGEIIQPSMSDVEKVKAINDYIVLNTTYSFDVEPTPHAAYAILKEGKGVCQAYALLAYRMLEEAGMEVRYVTGWAGEDHAWNKVKVDGEWYNLDTTWNDPVFPADSGDMSGFISYKYFLVSDRVLFQDHTEDEVSDYPAATSERFAAMRGMEDAVQVGDVLYYPNREDDLRLYKISLNEEKPVAQKISNTRVQHLFYANESLYFSNYSASAYLYKMNLDGTGETLVEREKVTDIKRVGNELVAYDGNQVIYREPIQHSDGDLQQRLQEVNELASNFVFLHEDFEQNAVRLIDLYDQLTTEEIHQLTNETQHTIATVKEKLEKMHALSFSTLDEWEPMQRISNVRKPWTITFNNEVLNSRENLGHIKIVNMFGEEVDATVHVNGKVVTITPNADYVENIPYTLIINLNLKDSEGNELSKGKYLQFKL